MSINVYPPQYHYRHKRESDLQWIEGMLKIIPPELRELACIEYSKIYGGGGGDKRRLANSFLKLEAAKYKAVNHDSST